MGSTASTQSARVHVGREISDIVKLMMPVYYTEESVESSDIEIAKQKWDKILNDNAPEFVINRDKPDFEYTSCMIMFYDSFYRRLFDVHPVSKPLFKAGLKSQGKFLVKMISLAVSIIDHDDAFRDTLVKLTETHNQRGVKSVEYGIVGEVLFWTLRHCLGPDYDPPTHNAWVKIYSRMLKVMVPVAVVFEMRNGQAQIDRFKYDDISSRDDIEKNGEVK